MLWVKTSKGEFLNLATASAVKVDGFKVTVVFYFGGAMVSDSFEGDDANRVMRILEAAADETRHMETQSWNRRNAQSYGDPH